MTTIYFAGSIRGGRNDAQWYQQIVSLLRKYGEVLTEHVSDGNLTADGEKGMTDDEIYQRDMDWLRRSNVLIAEVTQPSLGVGYEIGRAVEWAIPVLCIHRPMEERKMSAMISGNPDTRVCQYSSMKDLEGIVDHFLFGHLDRAEAGD